MSDLLLSSAVVLGFVAWFGAIFAIKWREAGNQCPHCRKAER